MTDQTCKLETAKFIVQQFEGLKGVPAADHPKVINLMKTKDPAFSFLLQRAHELKTYSINNILTIFTNIFKRVCNLFT